MALTAAPKGARDTTSSTSDSSTAMIFLSIDIGYISGLPCLSAICHSLLADQDASADSLMLDQD